MPMRTRPRFRPSSACREPEPVMGSFRLAAGLAALAAITLLLLIAQLHFDSPELLLGLTQRT